MLNQQIKHYVGIFNLYARLFHFNFIFSSILYFDTVVPFLSNNSRAGTAHSRVVVNCKTSPQRLTAMSICECVSAFKMLLSFLLSHAPPYSLAIARFRTSFSSYLLLLYIFQNIKLKIHQRKFERGKTLHKRIFYVPWQWDEISNEHVVRNTRYGMRCAAHMHSPETKQNEESAEQIQIYGVRVWIIYKMNRKKKFNFRVKSSIYDRVSTAMANGAVGIAQTKVNEKVYLFNMN